MGLMNPGHREPEPRGTQCINHARRVNESKELLKQKLPTKWQKGCQTKTFFLWNWNW